MKGEFGGDLGEGHIRGAIRVRLDKRDLVFLETSRRGGRISGSSGQAGLRFVYFPLVQYPKKMQKMLNLE